ncbi:ammonium transporter AmtB-like domain-containing protein [Lobosporangium transversale]|uniref:Ammonium transporter n=1 Tax=Lobosporangium transversale TaxID=64571 RepID=A0A1Y2GBZ7_9FUNG|nr:ammonium transporter AmtB-like domain-containing protein [Lobosporangium transversale]ORZ06735.1 ammonium transporter AmtB-like domain-containing protein [Lobosporangium transversale]|eukprot:XP_021877656.1 ammonium transporter AmtB-like domain-containing protein [Lobosporangium transversale]
MDPLAQPTEYKPGDIAWVLTSTALVFLMCPGLGLFYAGMARMKHSLSLMMLSVLAVAMISIQWYFWGYSLTFSTTGGPFIGNLDHIVGRGIGWEPHPSAPNVPGSAFFLFQLMFAAITPALAYGATAERMRIMPSILFLFVWSTLVYDVITYWVWGPNGWLTVMGVMDYAGGTPVHISSGSAAVAYAMVLGKRKDYNHPSTVPHNVAFVFIGTALLWFGWFGFNGGSALAANARGVQTIINSHLSACVGGLVWVMLDYRHNKKLTLIGFCTGAVAGLATITPGSGFVSSSSSLVFGLVGAAVCNVCVSWKSKYLFDDALDVFAVHYVGGLIGLILTGVFAQQSIIGLGYPVGATNIPLGGWLDGNPKQILVQLAAIVSVTGWSFVVTYGILYIMNKIPGMRLRLEDHEEEMGTDMAQMGETAYGFLPMFHNHNHGTNRDEESGLGTNQHCLKSMTLYARFSKTMSR